MSNYPQTIQIYLPSGDPSGIRIAALTTSIVQVIEVPRTLLAEFQAMAESKQTGLYVLVGDEADELDQPLAYIGESGNVGKRLGQHHLDPKMEFWTRALVAISLTHSFTATHTLYLEWSSIQKATQAGRFALKNANAGSKPHTPPPLEADCRQIFEILRILVSTLGQPVFEAFTKPKLEASGQQDGDAQGATAPELFYCRSVAHDATAQYTSEGMVVLKGSKARLAMTPSSLSEKGYLVKKRKLLLENGALKEEGEKLIFQRDVLFSSPSGASDVVVGASTNGWALWKSKEGKTLDELKRNSLEQQ